jgi:hypothetical protein
MISVNFHCHTVKATALVAHMANPQRLSDAKIDIERSSVGIRATPIRKHVAPIRVWIFPLFIVFSLVLLIILSWRFVDKEFRRRWPSAYVESSHNFSITYEKFRKSELHHIHLVGDGRFRKSRVSLTTLTEFPAVLALFHKTARPRLA